MKFVDIADIRIRAGRGGKGSASFRKEKYSPRGGPDGGDGGRGGDVFFRASRHMSTLLDFKYLDHYEAENGGQGLGRNMTGRNGKSLEIPVPIGTLVTDIQTGEVLADLTEEGAVALVARGGRGGLGNTHFKSSVNQAPRYAQPGEAGEEKQLRLELKLLADVGLIGLPNAGKSTLLSVISAARPKIADYPFTTLIPNLGVVGAGEHRSFVVADIPGLIEGAHQGAGLGIQFLRHVERTRVLVHLVDVTDFLETNPVDDYETVRRETIAFHPGLADRRTLVVAAKMDLAGDRRRFNLLRDYCREKGIPFHAISAATGEGVQQLVYLLADELEQLR